MVAVFNGSSLACRDSRLVSDEGRILMILDVLYSRGAMFGSEINQGAKVPDAVKRASDEERC